MSGPVETAHIPGMNDTDRRFCPSCGNPREGDLPYCVTCGHQISVLATPGAASQTVVARPAAPLIPSPSGGLSRYLPARTRERIGLLVFVLTAVAGLAYATNETVCFSDGCYESYSSGGALVYAVVNGLIWTGLFYLGAVIVWGVRRLLGKDEAASHNVSQPASDSRFTRNRTGWFLMAVVTLFLPFLWPFGAYVLIKLYQTRSQSPVATASVPPTWGAS